MHYDINLGLFIIMFCFEMSDPEIQTGCMNNKDGNFWLTRANLDWFKWVDCILLSLLKNH